MPHITIKVSDELYHHARLAAAHRNMSVSALLRAFLVTLDPTPISGKNDHQSFAESFPPHREADITLDIQNLLCSQYE